METRGHGPLTDAAARIKDAARELGFSSCGITDTSPPPHADALDAWLTAGMAGTMGYMPRQAAKRKKPENIVAGATRVVVVTRLFSPDDGTSPPADHGRIAAYARGPDYHDTLRAPLDELAGVIRSCGPEGTIAKGYVDAGPVPERELAQRAGLGWIGKNTMLIDPERGSFFFIASVFTDLDLPLDDPFEFDRCGSCRLCLDACPTAAFPKERVLDATRCISYLTIEYRGEFARSTELHEWLFGCDVCQTVCPWNQKFAAEVDDPTLGLDANQADVNLAMVQELNPESFAERFGATPLARPGLQGIRRNAAAIRSAQG